MSGILFQTQCSFSATGDWEPRLQSTAVQ